MYLAGVSARRVEDIIQALWGTKVCPDTVSKLNQDIYKRIEEARNQPLRGPCPYGFLDGIVLKRSWADEVRNISVLVAIAVNNEGYREVIGVAEGVREDKAGWNSFLVHFKDGGLSNVELFINNECMGLVESIAEFYLESRWQRCVVHFYFLTHPGSGFKTSIVIPLRRGG